MHTFIPRSLIVLAFAAGSAAASVRHLSIPVQPDESTIAYDMNEAGQVAVVLENDKGRQRAVMFEKGMLTDLGSLGGDYSNAKAINPSGQIVGSARDAAGHWRAISYDKARGMRDLGTLGGPSSFGMAINDAGDIAGLADTAEGDYHAVLYRADGTTHDLGTLGGKMSYAAGMNNAGQVVGTAALADGSRRAFVYDAARGMVDLGTLGGRISSATGINDAGVIVGASETTDRKWHAFIYENGRMVDLGAKIGYGNSFATAINSAGHVVGSIITGDERRSFVWRDGKVIVHRGHHSLFLANAINDEEQVVGAANGKRLHAATMHSSAAPTRAPQPVKQMGWVFVAGLIGAGALIIQRRRYQGQLLRSFT